MLQLELNIFKATCAQVYDAFILVASELQALYPGQKDKLTHLVHKILDSKEQ